MEETGAVLNGYSFKYIARKCLTCRVIHGIKQLHLTTKRAKEITMNELKKQIGNLMTGIVSFAMLCAAVILLCYGLGMLVYSHPQFALSMQEAFHGNLHIIWTGDGFWDKSRTGFGTILLCLLSGLLFSSGVAALLHLGEYVLGVYSKNGGQHHA